MTKEYTRQVMHNAIAHHPLTTQWATNPWPAPRSFIVQHDYAVEFFSGSADLAMLPHKLLCNTILQL